MFIKYNTSDMFIKYNTSDMKIIKYNTSDMKIIKYSTSDMKIIQYNTARHEAQSMEPQIRCTLYRINKKKMFNIMTVYSQSEHDTISM